MEETGIIDQLKENGFAVVKTTGGEQCEGCKCHGACHALGGGTERKITAFNQVGATVGDRVIITIGSGSFIKASLVVYLLPVLALVIGALLGEKYSSQIWPSVSPEMVSVVTGVTCLGVSFGAIRLFTSRLSQNQRYYPIIEEILPSPPLPAERD